MKDVCALIVLCTDLLRVGLLHVDLYNYPFNSYEAYILGYGNGYACSII